MQIFFFFSSTISFPLSSLFSLPLPIYFHGVLLQPTYRTLYLHCLKNCFVSLCLLYIYIYVWSVCATFFVTSHCTQLNKRKLSDKLLDVQTVWGSVFAGIFHTLLICTNHTQTKGATVSTEIQCETHSGALTCHLYTLISTKQRDKAEIISNDVSSVSSPTPTAALC